MNQHLWSLNRTNEETRKIFDKYSIEKSPCFITSLTVATANIPYIDFSPEEILDRLCGQFVLHAGGNSPIGFDPKTGGINLDTILEKPEMSFDLLNQMVMSAGLLISLRQDDIHHRLKTIKDEATFINTMKSYLKQLHTTGTKALIPTVYLEEGAEPVGHMISVIGMNPNNWAPLIFDQETQTILSISDEALVKLFTEKGLTYTNENGGTGRVVVQDYPFILVAPALALN